MSENVEAIVYKGLTHLRDHEYEKAKEVFEKAVGLEPQNGEARAWLAATLGRLVEKGSMVEKMKYFPSLEKEVAIALTLSPDSPLARRVNGFRLLYTPKEFGGNPKKAISELLFCIEQGVHEAEVYYALGLAYVQTEEQDKAIQAFEQALLCDPNHELSRQQLDGFNGSAVL